MTDFIDSLKRLYNARIIKIEKIDELLKNKKISYDEMFTVLINNDNSSVVTERQRIMQNSKLVDTLQIIVPKKYNELNMEDYKAYLEYLTPINHKHNYVELEIYDNNYKFSSKIFKTYILHSKITGM